MGVLTITAGCGDDDAAVFDGAQIPAVVPADDSVPTSSADDESDGSDPGALSTGQSTTTDDAATPASTPAEPTAPDDGEVAASALPTGGELLVEFTFAPTSSGERIHNPYIAVWIEDLDGNLVDTISLWYETGGRGSRWLRTLRQWSDLTEEVVDSTSSGATRPAGTYTVAWDGLDADGAAIAPGTYQLFVEAAREDGPYELSSTLVDFDGSEFEAVLPDDGELTNLTARVVA
ncbi:DUF2271 domain-containing protein [Ilumatobacter coccineus]|uniref:DUF2271 domain-containing protein n=1 Tax=Ilumatobacter coccineus TaxID=467094 RepID=UPI000345C814|nr:DUF2271 domain-containing protein [Ilumatobacter coccineus]